MKDPEEYVRSHRTIGIVHGEAFQLMLYRAKDGSELWFWNSRDGVTPFGTKVEGKDYTHAMHGYPARYQTALPREAEHVWVSYTVDSWRDMQSRKFDRFTALDDEHGDHFRYRFPKLEDWLAVSPFEHGQPRQLTRAEYLASTPEWVGALAA